MPDLQKMSKERFTILYHKYLSGSLKGVEREEWLTLLADDELAPELEKSLDWFNVPKEQEIGLSKLRVDAMVDSIVQHPQPRGKHVSLWPRVAIAAAIATMIFGAGLFYYNLNNKHQQLDQVALKNDVAPGRTGATLTLANGKKIRLNDAANGELAKEAGVVITKDKDGELVYEIKERGEEDNKINTLSTANGETYRLRLPDGSTVWLNSASSLRYSAKLTEDGKRRVSLKGEGFFEVAKDKAHPFVVQTASQEVEVLGTKFNINAYRDDPAVRTTLAEGSIRLTSQGKSVILKPNQQAVSANGTVEVKDVDAELALAWKSGFFLFDAESLESIMAKIARWYDVEIIFNDAALKAKTFTGTVSRFDKISQVFKVLEKSEVAKFKIEGRKVTIDKIK